MISNLFDLSIIGRFHLAGDDHEWIALILIGELLDGGTPAVAEEEDLLWGGFVALVQLQRVLNHDVLQLDTTFLVDV